MELLYLWIEEFKNIKNQGFNFSPEYHFHFDNETRELSVEKRKGLPKNFFGENIVNVTAIVGENGAGKSNLLEFAKFYSYGIFPGSCPYVIAFKSIDFDEIDMYYSSFKEIPDIKIKMESNYSIHKLPLGGIRKGANVFYFNNAFDPFNFKSEEIRKSELNISITQNFFRKLERHLSTEFDKKEVKKVNSVNPFWNALDLTLKDNFLEILETVLSLKHLSKNLRLPKYLVLTFNDSFSPMGRFEIYKSLRIKDEKKKNKFIEDLNFIYEFFDTKDWLSKIRVRAIFQIIYTTLINCNYNKAEVPDLLMKEANLCKHFLEEGIIPEELHFFSSVFSSDVIDWLSKHFSKFLRNNSSDIHVPIRFTIPLYNELEEIKELFTYLKNWDATIGALFSFTLAHEDESLFVQRAFSNGEIALLNLYSSINELNENSPNELLLLIDEGDQGFHPDWQRNILFSLLRDLPIILPNSRIQLIYTSHSPFVISDLPKQNVIFLEKDKETGNAKVVEGVRKSATFGANIHTLFADAFFMEGGLIGEFAKGKINEIIQVLRPIIRYEQLTRKLNAAQLKKLDIAIEFLQKLVNIGVVDLPFDKISDKESLENELKNVKKLTKKIISAEKLTDNWGNVKNQGKIVPLNDIYLYLIAKAAFTETKQDIKTIIEMIGDAVVRDKLEEMYYQALHYVEGQNYAEREQLAYIQQLADKMGYELKPKSK